MWHCHFKEYLCPCRPSPVSPGWWCTAGHPTHLTRTSHSSWQYSDIGVQLQCLKLGVSLVQWPTADEYVSADLTISSYRCATITHWTRTSRSSWQCSDIGVPHNWVKKGGVPQVARPTGRVRHARPYWTRTSRSSWQYSDIGVRSLVLTTVRHRRSHARPDRFLLIVQFLNFFTLSFSPSSLSLSPHLHFLILPIFTFSFSPSLLSHSPHLCFLFLHIFTFSACSSLVVVVVAVCIYHLFCHKPSTVNHVYRAIYT